MAMRNTMVAILTACLLAGETQTRSDGHAAQDKKEKAKEAKSQATTTAASAGEDPAYKIGPQDVLEINSRRIYVTGEVTKPGTYALLPHMTVLQALSSSGGFTQFAREKNIYVLRTENSKQAKIPFNYKEAVKGKNAAQNIELLPGDVIVVP